MIYPGIQRGYIRSRGIFSTALAGSLVPVSSARLTTDSVVVLSFDFPVRGWMSAVGMPPVYCLVVHARYGDDTSVPVYATNFLIISDWSISTTGCFLQVQLSWVALNFV